MDAVHELAAGVMGIGATQALQSAAMINHTGKQFHGRMISGAA
jgi:hypothetical protein